MQNPRSPRRSRLIALLVGIVASAMIGLAMLKLIRADAGIDTQTVLLGATPITVYRATGAGTSVAKPVVLISHGFAGSQQLMEPFATTLAKNGMLVVTFDYYGHGRNREPLRGDVTKIDGATQFLLEQTGEVANYALSLDDANGQLSLLGHSMASDIIVRYAQQDARVDSTIAVSMFSPAVSAAAPKNLLMIVGGLEAFLKEEALRVLGLVSDKAQPGQTVESGGEAGLRRVAIAEGVEHVGVLYSVDSMTEASEWLKRIYPSTQDSAYRDQRGPYIMLSLLGLLVLAWPLARCLPTVSSPARGASLRWKQLLVAGLIPAIGTPLILLWFPADFLGVLVGGYLAVHFAVYGVLTLLCLRYFSAPRDHAPIKATTSRVRFVVACLLATAYAAGLVGFVLDSYVTSLAIVPLRIPLVACMFIGTLMYFLSDEWLVHGRSHARGGHLFTRFCFLLSLAIATALSFEELFFLLIIAGVIVVYFIVYGLLSRWTYQSTGHPAVGGIANAVAVAWALAAVFPVMSPA